MNSKPIKGRPGGPISYAEESYYVKIWIQGREFG